MQQDTKLVNLLTPTIESLDLELVGIEVVNGKTKTLRVYLDKKGGITLDECANASRSISRVLDVEDYSNSAYSLEVSSPGVERPLFTLEHFTKFIGHKVKVKLFAPVKEMRNITANISSVNENIVKLELMSGAKDIDYIEVDFDNIVKANLVGDL